MTSQQRKSKSKNDKRLDQKQARAKEAAAAANKKSNKLMEVGAGATGGRRAPVAAGGCLWEVVCSCCCAVPAAFPGLQPGLAVLALTADTPHMFAGVCCRRPLPPAA